MHGRSASTNSRPMVRRSRKSRLATRAASCFLSVAAAAAFVTFFSRGENGTLGHLIWVSNGVLLAYLLLARLRNWPAFLAAGFAAQVASCLIVDGRLHSTSLFLNALNLVEVLIGAYLLRRRSTGLPNFANRAYLLRFGGAALLAGPVAAGAIFALFSAEWRHVAPGHAFLCWTAVDSLGTAIATPACVALLRGRFNSAIKDMRSLAYPVLLAVVAFAAFSQHAAPLLAFIHPLLILILVSLGMEWASLATLFIAMVGGWYANHGVGLLALSTSISPVPPSVRMQMFVASSIFMLYAISVVLENRREIQRRLQKIVSLHALVTENSRDAILIVDFDGYSKYVSPAMERMTGWNPEQMRLQGGSNGLIHPEDLPEIQNITGHLQAGAKTAMTKYRVRKPDGQYLWVEASIKVLTDPVTGVATGTLNILRDISERMRAEEKLQQAYNAVEALAITDALTGLANRRRFDQYLAGEWRRGLRDHTPLSMLLIDVDLFKSYNDTYGHVRGDSCLKQISEAALDVVSRPGDLVARFGGEEFAVILPNTSSEGASRIAHEICDALRHKMLPHSSNPTGIMTVSVGCGTMVPSFGLHSVNLIELADDALYKAKRNGRNQVCNGNDMKDAEGKSQENELSQPAVGKTA